MGVCQVLTVCILFAAAGAPGAEGTVADALTAPHWEIAPEICVFRYEEPGLMRDKGILYGGTGAYTHYRGHRLFRIEGEFAYGTVDYEGSLVDYQGNLIAGASYKMEGNQDFLLNLRLLGGRQWEHEGWDNRFYLGLGYRGLSDDSSQDPAGYERLSSYFYLPLGLKMYHHLASRWQIGLGGEFDLLLVGVQLSHILNDGTLTNVQWPGVGTRVSVELRHRTRSADLALAPFLQYWWVDDSTSSHGWYEPHNQSFQYGLSLIWRF
jgi:hypothetical protein